MRLVVDDERQAERLRRMLSEHELEAWPGVTLWSSEGLGVVVGECAAGFQLPALGLVVLSEQEIFGAQRRRLRRPLFQRGAAIAAFTDLAPNDLVVHEMHGIARYHGLRTLSTDGRDADFLLLEYADGGRLYLPVERLDLISKYMGAPDGAARLDRLGGAAWAARQGIGARRAPRDGGGACCGSTPRGRSSSGPRSPRTPRGRASSRRRSASRRRATRSQAIEDVKADMASTAADGPARRRRRGLRQDRGGAARRVQGGGRRPPGRGARADHRARAAALQHVQRAVRPVPRAGGAALALSEPPRSRRR